MDDLSSEEAENVSDAMDRMDGDNGDGDGDDTSQESSSSSATATLETDETPDAAEGNGDKKPGKKPAKKPAKKQDEKPGDAPADEQGNSGVSKAQFMQLEEVAAAADLPPTSLDKMHHLKVNVQVILGRTKMSLEKILSLHPGTVVELNKLAGEPVDLTANDKLIARAEVVVIDGNFGVKVIEIAGMRQDLSR